MKPLRKSKVGREEIRRMYEECLLTMEEIGCLAGISKQAVRLILNQSGVSYKGGKVPRICKYCGNEFLAQRNRIKRNEGDYCSIPCFHAARVLDPNRFIVISETKQRGGNKTAKTITKLKLTEAQLIMITPT